MKKKLELLARIVCSALPSIPYWLAFNHKSYECWQQAMRYRIYTYWLVLSLATFAAIFFATRERKD